MRRGYASVFDKCMHLVMQESIKQERGCSLADAGGDTSRIPSTQTVCLFLGDLKEDLEGDASALKYDPRRLGVGTVRAQITSLGRGFNAVGT